MEDPGAGANIDEVGLETCGVGDETRQDKGMIKDYCDEVARTRDSPRATTSASWNIGKQGMTVTAEGLRATGVELAAPRPPRAARTCRWAST